MSSKFKPELQLLPVERLSRGVYQPRREFDEVTLHELAESIESAGMIQPIVVRPKGENFEIVAGERRWRAAQIAGMHEVPCLVNYYSDEQTAAVTTIENINRVDLNPIEEAKAYERLIDEFGYLHEEVAAVVGKSRTKISNSLRLLKCDKVVQQYLIEGRISEGHGKVLAGLSRQLQVALVQKCVSRGWNVRKMELEAKKAQEDKQGHSNNRDPNIKSLERALTQHIGCKVNIDFDEDKGQVKIDFNNLDILEGIFSKMGFKFEENE